MHCMCVCVLFCLHPRHIATSPECSKMGGRCAVSFICRMKSTLALAAVETGMQLSRVADEQTTVQYTVFRYSHRYTTMVASPSVCFLILDNLYI